MEKLHLNAKRKIKNAVSIYHYCQFQKIYDIGNKNCPDCGSILKKIGENIRKELVYHSARYKVIEHIRYVYTCDRYERDSSKSKIFKTDMKEPVIYKSFASPSLLSYIIDNKFNKALPLYRQKVMFNQAGLKLSRQTMVNFIILPKVLSIKKPGDRPDLVSPLDYYLKSDINVEPYTRSVRTVLWENKLSNLFLSPIKVNLFTLQKQFNLFNLGLQLC